MFHLSEVDGLSRLVPTLPRKPSAGVENLSVPRICFAPTIHQAILGLQLSDVDIGANGHCVMHVYMTTDVNGLIDNDFLVSNRYVFDAMVTGETWGTDPTPVEQVGSIRIYNKVVHVIQYRPLLGPYTKAIKPYVKKGLLTTYALGWEVVGENRLLESQRLVELSDVLGGKIINIK